MDWLHCGIAHLCLRRGWGHLLFQQAARREQLRPLTKPRLRRSHGIISILPALIAIALLASCSDGRSDDTLTSVESFIVTVREDGFYQISLDSLAQAGANMVGLRDVQSKSPPPRLSDAGVVIPLLQTEDSWLFYGQAPTDRYSRFRPYLLELEEPGLAMETEKQPPAGTRPLEFVPFSQSFEQNNFYDGQPYSGLPEDPAARDPWYWDTIQVQDVIDIDFDMPRDPQGEAELALELVGVSNDNQIDEDHDLDVYLNETLLETVRWDGESAVRIKVAIPDGLLQQDANRLTLDNTAPGATVIDITRLDRFIISYWAIPDAVNGRIQTEGFMGSIAMEGFDGVPLIFDISHPHAPVALSGKLLEDGRAGIQVDNETHLYAVDSDGLSVPEAIVARGEPELRRIDTQADLIVIAPEVFIEALEPLADHRRKQGLAVKLVELEQIYSEFGEVGIGPRAITAFLAHAYTNWSGPKPSYLLLVADASFDYRDYLGQQRGLMLPAPMVPVTYSGETVSDARLADIDGDRRPDMAIGRWPVSQIKEVEDLVKRTIASEQAEIASTAIFAADGSESRFYEMNERASEYAAFRPEQSTQLNGPTNQEIAAAWAEGAWLFTYTGHGSLDRWGKDDLLSSEHVSVLESDESPPVVLQLTCLTGLFAHPTIESLSEGLLLHDQGPISIVAATSLSLSDHQEPFGLAFLQELGNPEVMRIGDAFQTAKGKLDIESNDALREISDTYTLFGDPTALIRRPNLQ